MSEFVCGAPGKGVCVEGDLVVAEQNTKGSSKGYAGEWQVCEAETRRVGNHRGSRGRLGRAGLTLMKHTVSRLTAHARMPGLGCTCQVIGVWCSRRVCWAELSGHVLDVGKASGN